MCDESPITNAERAERAHKALEAYTDEHDLVANMVDFLSDLEHYCNIACTADISHPTFDDLLKTARQHFDAEINGEE